MVSLLRVLSTLLLDIFGLLLLFSCLFLRDLCETIIQPIFFTKEVGPQGARHARTQRLAAACMPEDGGRNGRQYGVHVSGGHGGGYVCARDSPTRMHFNEVIVCYYENYS